MYVDRHTPIYIFGSAYIVIIMSATEPLRLKKKLYWRRLLIHYCYYLRLREVSWGTHDSLAACFS